MFRKTIFVGSIFFATTLAQFYEDKRCRCVCPSPTSIFNDTEKSKRTLYIAFVPPHKWRLLPITQVSNYLLWGWTAMFVIVPDIYFNMMYFTKVFYNCYGVILPKVTDRIRDNIQIFCQRCDCKYETRNTTVIMIAVILVLWVLMLLIGYFIFLTLLKYLVSKKRETYSRVDINSAEGENLLTEGEGTDD